MKFLKIVVLIFLCSIGTVVATVAVAYALGTVTVSVREKRPGGSRIYAPVPAIVVTEGLRLAPSRDLADAVRQARPWLPTIKAAGKELLRCPDATLVEVHDHDNQVRILKQGARLVVDVNSPEDEVHVAVPIQTAIAVADTLESASNAGN